MVYKHRAFKELKSFAIQLTAQLDMSAHAFIYIRIASDLIG